MRETRWEKLHQSVPYSFKNCKSEFCMGGIHFACIYGIVTRYSIVRLGAPYKMQFPHETSKSAKSLQNPHMPWALCSLRLCGTFSRWVLYGTSYPPGAPIWVSTPHTRTRTNNYWIILFSAHLYLIYIAKMVEFYLQWRRRYIEYWC